MATASSRWDQAQSAGGHRQPEIDISVTPELAARCADAASAMGAVPQSLDCHQHPRYEGKLSSGAHAAVETDLLLILVPAIWSASRCPRHGKAEMSFTHAAPTSSTSGWRYHGRTDAALRHCRPRFRRRQPGERGGHNPLEPAAHAIPVLGWAALSISDYRAKLQQDDGLITVTDANSLVKEVSTLLTDEDYRLWYGMSMRKCCTRTSRARCRVCQLLQPYLPQRSH